MIKFKINVEITLTDIYLIFIIEGFMYYLITLGETIDTNDEKSTKVPTQFGFRSINRNFVNILVVFNRHIKCFISSLTIVGIARSYTFQYYKMVYL